MFQNDNATNDLINGLVNDHDFKDMTVARVKTYIQLFLNNLGYYKQ